MKKLFTALVLLFLWSCKEDGVQLAKPSTFVRYFSGGFPDEAQAIIETSDNGFLILANSLTNTTLNNTYYKIKLIKTDAYGNQVWQKIIPEFPLPDAPPADSTLSYRGFGLAAIKDNSGVDTGYVIVGEEIKGSKRDLLMVQVQIDTKGQIVNSTPKTFFGLKEPGVGKVSIQGTAVSYSAASNKFFVLGLVQSATNDMFFAQVDGTTLDTLWTKYYQSVTSSLANRIYLDPQETYAYWGGTRYNSNPTSVQIRFVKSGLDAQTVVFDRSYPVNGAYNITGNDFIPYQSGYAFVGSHLLSGSNNQYDSIVFSQMDPINGNPFGTVHQYPLKFSQTIQPGNSICSTNDGGVLMLGTIALDAQGTDLDYYLIKIDGFGNKQWTRQHGSKFKDIGSKVLQASDGGYIVLGATTLANVPSIFLMKTDSEGNIQ